MKTALNWLKGGPQTIATLAEKEMSLAAQAESKTLELQAAERAAGEAFLNDEGGNNGVDSVLRLRTELDAIEHAVGAVRARRREVILTSFKAQAKQARADASAKQAELDALVNKSAKLIEQLCALEGIDGGLLVPNGQPQLRSGRLAEEISGLLQKADSLDAQDVPNSGMFDNEDNAVLDNTAIVAAVLQCASDGPSCRAVRAWLSAVEGHAAARNKFPDSFEKLPRRVRIEWRDGNIVRDSYIFTPGLTNPRAGDLSVYGPDLASGKFSGGMGSSPTPGAPVGFSRGE